MRDSSFTILVLLVFVFGCEILILSILVLLVIVLPCVTPFLSLLLEVQDSNLTRHCLGVEDSNLSCHCFSSIFYFYSSLFCFKILIRHCFVIKIPLSLVAGSYLSLFLSLDFDNFCVLFVAY